MCENVKILLESGADPNIPDCNGNIPLHLCGINFDIVQLLIYHGSLLTAKNDEEITPMNRIHDYYRRTADNYSKRNKIVELENLTIEYEKFCDFLAGLEVDAKSAGRKV